MREEFGSFFLECMPTPELALCLLDLCSYAISGIRTQHFFISFEESRGNGKFLFTILLERMLKDLIITANAKMILGKSTKQVHEADT